MIQTKKSLCFFIYIILFSLISLFGKDHVLIMVPAYNHAEYIELQDKALKKFSQDAYTFIVFNDASQESHRLAIEETCASLTIECIRVPQENRATNHKFFSWASFRHAQVIDYMMATRGFEHDGIVILMDSDLFLFKPFSFAEYLNGYDIAGIKQKIFNKQMQKPQDEYLWAGLIFFNMKTLKNKHTIHFAPIVTDSLLGDSGSSIQKYFAANPSTKKRFFEQEARIQLDKNLYPFYFYPPPSRKKFPLCSVCTQFQHNHSLPYATNKNCVHITNLFKQLYFSPSTIQEIQQKLVPSGTEFILGDTFFHVCGSSGYIPRTKSDVLARNQGIERFLHSHLS